MANEDSPLPRDAWELALAKLTGLPNGAHTPPSMVQSVDFYGNVTAFMVQTVKWDEGTTVFLTQVNGAKSERFILPPKVLAVIARQQAAVRASVRRRHGQRLAESQKAAGRRPPGFTPEAREKAQATRRANAERKRRRSTRRKGR